MKKSIKWSQKKGNRKQLLIEIRRTFFAGLLVLTPISLTIYIFIILFKFLDGLLNNVVTRFLIERLHWSSWLVSIPGLGLLVLLALVFFVGAIARNYFGSKLLAVGEYIVTHTPLINRIYIAIREISEAVLTEKREVFKKAVLIEYPRKGLYSVAFFTQDTKGPVQKNIKEDVISVFLPTTPNPTSGYLLFVPKSQVKELDMSVEDALKLVISGGSIHVKDQRGFGQMFNIKKIK